MAKVDLIFLTTTIIHCINRDKKVGNATGFFFSFNNQVFLVTNKHVIYGDNYSSLNSKTQIDKINIILHTDANNLSYNSELIINLFENGEKKWFEHEKNNIDVICIPISIDYSKYQIATINEDWINPENIEIIFEKIFVMGYPHGWYDQRNNLPITRIGHLSSPFGVSFSGNPFMLGDVETHPGMSGSPVFMILKDYISINSGKRNINLGKTKKLLLGIFSGQPKWEVASEDGKKINIPHSLSVIWFSTILKEIIKK